MRCAAVLLVVLTLMIWALPASAKSYPPNAAGLRQLVSDDAAMLPPRYAGQLRKQESDWERGIGVTCYSKSQCYPTAQNMIQTIQQHIFKENGYVFGDVEWKTSFKPPHEAAQYPLPLSQVLAAEKPVLLDQNIPQIVTPLSPQALSLNAAMRAFALSFCAQDGGPLRSDPKSDAYEDFSLDYFPNFPMLHGVLSITFLISDYSHGAADGDYLSEEFNWFIKENRAVVPNDIFKRNVDWRSAVASTGLAALLAITGGSTDGLPEDSMDYDLADPRLWAFLQSGLEVFTYENKFGPGIQSAIIPWATLEPYLKSGKPEDNF